MTHGLERTQMEEWRSRNSFRLFVEERLADFRDIIESILHLSDSVSEVGADLSNSVSFNIEPAIVLSIVAFAIVIAVMLF